MWQLREFCTDEKISNKDRYSYAQSAINLNKSYCNDSDFIATASTRYTRPLNLK